MKCKPRLIKIIVFITLKQALNITFSWPKVVFASATHIFNPFKPEFTIVIFIHYNPRFAVAILDL